MREFLERVGSFMRRSEKREESIPASGRFDADLDSFRQFKGLSKDSQGMRAVEEQLSGALKMGIDRTHCDDIALGIAIVRGHMGTAMTAAMIFPPTGGMDHFFTREHDKSISETAEWLSTRGDAHSKEEIAKLLSEIEVEFGAPLS